MPNHKTALITSYAASLVTSAAIAAKPGDPPESRSDVCLQASIVVQRPTNAAAEMTDLVATRVSLNESRLRR